MIDFTALETEKTKIRQMSLKELFSYGEKVYYVCDDGYRLGIL